MSNDKHVPGIIFGDPDRPLANAAFYDKDLDQYVIAIYPILNDEGLKPGDTVPIDRVGDCGFVFVFKTITSVDNMIERLNWIKNAMQINDKGE